MNPKQSKMQNEFNEFLNTPEMEPPAHIAEKVLQRTHRLLYPDFFSISLKILGIHAALSAITLSLCSQFGIQVIPFFDLMDSFMSIVGHTYCMAFCGAFYLGTSAILLCFVFSPEEMRAVRAHSVLQFLILAGLSLGGLFFFGAELFLIPVAIWIAGGLFAWVSTIEIGWRVRAQNLGLQ